MSGCTQLRSSMARLLVCEDSPVIQKLIDMCLKPMGIEIEFHADGAEGLQSALANPPDAMVLDIGLPSMNGWEVLTELRKQPQTRSVPVMVLTAHGRHMVARQADAHDADAALSKPFNPTEFRMAVTRLIENEAA